ncbi:hypothetical protein RclHR1_06150015 [Rhizophagus clarus]|uniref:F-box domain-containing protein n=1 Tax=Rhizophagus clarus TaxID=94130 RepID=A0A2Z6SI01_9GLOM|nr:hypothetical protein RclHR1_06150015 [Rhizophagus clarus]GES98887.1 hypothetical protein GLOIN_2v1774509 [Rhizophagus clarus]
MSKFNKDVIYQILEELQDDSKSLYSCLLINRTWCETTVPILWKFPGRYVLNNSNNKLFNVILLQLSEKSRDNLKNVVNNIFTESFRPPLFNYIKFWRHLNLRLIESMMINSKDIVKSKIYLLRNEILKLFINENTRYISLIVPSKFKYRIYNLSGAERCFSDLEYIFFYGNEIDNLIGLSKISQSIKKMRFDKKYILKINNSGITKLIESQKNLKEITFNRFPSKADQKSLEEAIIKSANTIQHVKLDWKPFTKILTYLVNLTSLEICLKYNMKWENLEDNISLPLLTTLKTWRVLPKIVISLIKSTKGQITKLSYNYYHINNKLTKVICKNCPKLEYFKTSINYKDKTTYYELEKILINCQYLKGLCVQGDHVDLDLLSKILNNSSPVGLFKLKFSFFEFKFGHLKSFFDNWTKSPMLLEINTYLMHLIESPNLNDLVNLIRMYESNVIKHYKIIDIHEQNLDNDFTWNTSNSVTYLE